MQTMNWEEWYGRIVVADDVPPLPVLRWFGDDHPDYKPNYSDAALYDLSIGLEQAWTPRPRLVRKARAIGPRVLFRKAFTTFSLIGVLLFLVAFLFTPLQ